MADSANKTCREFRDGTNTGNDYPYDGNGNMVSDANKGISIIAYNYLNLPTGISINGSGGNGTISYIYDATGNKLEKKVIEGSTTTRTFYGGNYVYEKVNTNSEVLKFFNHPEGYVDAEGGFEYVYQYKDHLGNIRLSYKNVSLTGTPSLQIMEENNYYPFGLKHKGYNYVSTSSNIALKKTYNGKEFQVELGLNWHDYGARNYDASLGRWMNVDPLVEEAPNWTPYRYGFNNPIRYTDPSGMYENDDWYKNLESGNYEWFDGSADKKGYWNLGKETDIAVGEGYALRDNGVFTDNKTEKTYGREQSLKVKEGGGFTIKSNGTFGEKISHLSSDFIAPFLEIAQDIIFPIVNQANTIINEGVHDRKHTNTQKGL